MKKILSMLLTVCMMCAFAVSVSAADLGYSIDVVETESGATVDIALVGDYNLLGSFQVVLKYDATKLTYASKTEDTTFTSKLAPTWVDGSNFNWKDGFILYTWSDSNSSNANYLNGTGGLKFVTLTFNKVNNAELANGDIQIVASEQKGMSTKKTNVMANSTTTTYDGLTITPSFTEYVAPTPVTPVAPTVTTPSEGIVGELKNVTYVDADKAYTWDLDVTVPIGKVASVSDGTNEPFIVTNGKATGKSPSGSTLTVSYTDAEGTVITYVVPMSKIYGENNGIAAFGKNMSGTISSGRYGIKFTGLTGTYDGVENYEFDADGNVNGIFAVEVADAPAGVNYKAQAYVGTTYGAEISFTK